MSLRMASHQKALAAIAAGRFADEIVPVPVTNTATEWEGQGEDAWRRALRRMRGRGRIRRWRRWRS